jgi:hypothetical protein
VQRPARRRKNRILHILVWGFKGASAPLPPELLCSETPRPFRSGPTGGIADPAQPRAVKVCILEWPVWRCTDAPGREAPAGAGEAEEVSPAGLTLPLRAPAVGRAGGEEVGGVAGGAAGGGRHREQVQAKGLVVSWSILRVFCHYSGAIRGSRPGKKCSQRRALQASKLPGWQRRAARPQRVARKFKVAVCCKGEKDTTGFAALTGARNPAA